MDTLLSSNGTQGDHLHLVCCLLELVLSESSKSFANVGLPKLYTVNLDSILGSCVYISVFQ